MTQHATLSPERWGAFALKDQILMIANEMNRGLGLFGPGDVTRLRRSYERSLRLADLTIEVQEKPQLRRELLRWREVVAELYLSEHPEALQHRRALRALLLLHPATVRQESFLSSPEPEPAGG